ncbi:Sel1-like protein [Artemisia annua]|uniref:Sel1-like protein n=1 Tax=Artemisia annua TaxID=35608 RepID=A0A2U1KY57_ARTAN|nr:Sel1-like protein [Artemisia annua]
MSGSVTRITNSNVSSRLNYFDMVDYAIDYENLGTTITEDEEKLMDEIEWSSVSEIVPPTTHTVTNQPPHAPNANMNDPVDDPVHDEVNATVVEAPIDDSVHDVSHASNELTIAVNTVVCPPSNATVVREIDEMPDEVNVNNMNFEVNEVAVPQLMEIIQDEGDEELGQAWIRAASRSRSSVWKVGDKRPGYNASDSDSDEVKAGQSKAK